MGSHILDQNNNEILNDSHMNLNAITNKEFCYEKVKHIADWILSKTEHRPKIGVICGSGLGGIGDLLKDTNTFPYEKIPYFPQSTVAGHKGNLIFGTLNGKQVVCMQGRFHAYEGYSNALCTMPMKVFKLLGVETVIITNAAGAINRSYEPGDIMIIKDHIAPLLWTLQNPLVGHNDERFGPRFPATNKIYTRALRDEFKKICQKHNVTIKEGIYSSLGGPCYETVSELRGLQLLGADAVGMSTAHEALVASYCGIKVFALSLITNTTILEYDSEEFPNHQEVIENANKTSKLLETLISELIENISENKN